MSLFKHAPKDRYTATVTILIPGDDGEFEKTKMKVEFRRLNAPQSIELIGRLGAADPTEDVMGDVLRENIKGWSGVPAAAGGEVPFSAENLEEMLKIPCYRRGLFNRFFEDMRGPAEQARKN